MKYVANFAHVPLQTEIYGECYSNLKFMKQCYNDFKLNVMHKSIFKFCIKLLTDCTKI